MAFSPFKCSYLPEELMLFPLTISDCLNENKILKNNNNFQVIVDVQHFSPNDLTVKVSNNEVIVEGRHEEREDEHGYIWRQFYRRYTLPDDYDPADVVSNLSYDGILKISAPKKQPASANSDEGVVRVKLTGPVCNTLENK